MSLVEEAFNLDNAIQTKAEFLFAIAVIDRIGGWEEEEGEQENCVGPRFSASMWVCTIAVVCHWQNHMQNCRIFKWRSIMEAVNWVTTLLTSTCGCPSRQYRWRKQKFWNPCIMTVKSRAKFSGRCCGSLHLKPQQWTSEWRRNLRDVLWGSQPGVPECFLCSIFCGKHTKDLFPDNSQESFGRDAWKSLKLGKRSDGLGTGWTA